MLRMYVPSLTFGYMGSHWGKTSPGLPTVLEDNIDAEANFRTKQ